VANNRIGVSELERMREEAAVGKSEVQTGHQAVRRRQDGVDQDIKSAPSLQEPFDCEVRLRGNHSQCSQKTHISTVTPVVIKSLLIAL